MIYCGVSSDGNRPSNPQSAREHSILAVGTIEPRKNYPTLLDAFERLVHEQGDLAPTLTVVGNTGWMSEGVERRLLALQEAGRCRWIQNASDEQLAEAYSKAGVFTYLSLSEGFGYPPFESAFAHCPMVLSSASSVGEIWSDHAKCVGPLDVEAIVAGWKWALALSPMEWEDVIVRQERRAQEFTWSRSMHEYFEFWNRLLSNDDAMELLHH
jgi:glycosyltransferase involved in cell wall biosynthesis